MLNEHIVVGEGVEHVNFGKMISLNKTAAFLWQSVEGKDFTVEDLADLLVGEYGIDKEQALADSKSIAEKLIEVGVVAE